MQSGLGWIVNTEVAAGKCWFSSSKLSWEVNISLGQQSGKICFWTSALSVVLRIDLAILGSCALLQVQHCSSQQIGRSVSVPVFACGNACPIAPKYPYSLLNVRVQK